MRFSLMQPSLSVVSPDHMVANGLHLLEFYHGEEDIKSAQLCCDQRCREIELGETFPTQSPLKCLVIRVDLGRHFV